MYVGIDQSLASPGFCILNATEHTPILLTTRPTKKLRGGVRLKYIADYLRELFKTHKIAQVALEGYSYGSTGAVFELGEIGGVVRLVCADYDVPYVVVAPAALKKYVGVPCTKDKDKIRHAVIDTWHLDITQNDACDAYVLAQIARAARLREFVTRRCEGEVISKL